MFFLFVFVQFSETLFFSACFLLYLFAFFLCFFHCFNCLFCPLLLCVFEFLPVFFFFWWQDDLPGQFLFGLLLLFSLRGCKCPPAAPSTWYKAKAGTKQSRSKETRTQGRKTGKTGKTEGKATCWISSWLICFLVGGHRPSPDTLQLSQRRANQGQSQATKHSTQTKFQHWQPKLLYTYIAAEVDNGMSKVL